MLKKTLHRDIHRIGAPITYKPAEVRGVIAALLLATLPLSATAQPLEEDYKLSAEGAGALHHFGGSVAIDGSIAIVGSPSYPSPLISTGAAYVFDTTTGQQLFRLEAAEGVEHDQLGSAVALSGNIAIVGAFGDDSAAFNAGAVYVFDVSTGEQLFKLTAPDANASMHFGARVAISDTLAIVGAYDAREAGIAVGAAYVFDVTTGEQLFKLSASDAQRNDRFGFAVDIDGTIAVVGAPGDDDGGPSIRTDGSRGENFGAAYVFDLTTGEELFKFFNDDPAASDGFGATAAISGNRALIGSMGDDTAAQNAGSALVFDLETERSIRKLTTCDGIAGNSFGRSVALSGSIAVVGAYYDEDGMATGTAYVFDLDTGTLLLRLRASDRAEYDDFGYSVTLSGNTALVGAPDDDDGGVNSGSVYAFTIQPGAPCPGDVTGDYKVDMADLNLVLSAFGQNQFCGDATGGGVVDLADLNVVLANYGRTCD